MLLCVCGCWMVECCFTSTETVGLSGTGAQDGHLDFHTGPELSRVLGVWGVLCSVCVVCYVCVTLCGDGLHFRQRGVTTSVIGPCSRSCSFV